MKLILILLLALGFVLGPIMMMRPNASQKRREQWRALARARGMHFSMRKLPRQADESEEPEALPMYFFAPKKQGHGNNWLALRTNYHHDLNLLGWWSWQGDARPTPSELALLEAELPKLPLSVKAVSSGLQGAAIYWTETGTAEDLELVLEVLEKFNAAVDA